MKTAPVMQVAAATSRPNFVDAVPRNDVVKTKARRKFVHWEMLPLKFKETGENCPSTCGPKSRPRIPAIRDVGM